MAKAPQKAVQPELTTPEGKNVMPNLPRVNQLVLKRLDLKGDLKAAADRGKEDLQKLDEQVRKELEKENRASYRFTHPLSGQETIVERLERGPCIRYRKAGKPGGGRTRRAI